MAYVYIYLDPRKDNEPIYVGKGTKESRMTYHLNDCKNPILESKIKKIRKEGLEQIVQKIKDNISNEDAIELEKNLILKFGRIDLKNGTLCNLTDGGEGAFGRIISEETKILMSEQRKGKKQTPAQYAANCNRKVSEETKKKISDSNKGRKLSQESIDKIKKAHTGSKRSEETKILMSEQRKGKKQTPAQYAANCNRKPKTRKIECINNSKIYNSAKQAAEELNLKSTAIQAVANGSRKQHKGYLFKYVD